MPNVTHAIHGINGPVVTVAGRDFMMQETVFVGHERLIGEVIGVHEDKTVIQVYENTTGLRPGEPVFSTGRRLSVTLGPGIVGNIFDGIERPLKVLEKQSGAFLARGSAVDALDTGKRWEVRMDVRAGDRVQSGRIFARCDETPSVEHRSMIPPGIAGTVVWAASDGAYTVEEPLIRVRDDAGNEHEIALAQRWPIRVPRPVARRVGPFVPLITGQRVIDSLIPIAKGGAAAVPGGFGTGKTMTQHQLAKWCDADIIVYVGCGERGNEMTQVLDEFGDLTDPRTGAKLGNRTVLIANTSNMPVAAREASVYTGITIAEYYRDMGYDVALMADSTSRWAEALREISGRLEEMPAEEGFPAYLPSRLSEFYERAGRAEVLSGGFGSVTVIGAVSPQGADFSEPVTQNTKRFIRCFWALDKALAYARHYPAINWIDSYSEYDADLADWYEENVHPDFMRYREEILKLLREETALMEIVKLVGADVLPDEQKLVIEIARIVRLGFLQQNAYHKEDTYVPLEKQFLMMKAIIRLYRRAAETVARDIPLSRLTETGICDRLIRMKYEIPNDDLGRFDELLTEIDRIADALLNSRTNA